MCPQHKVQHLWQNQISCTFRQELYIASISPVTRYILRMWHSLQSHAMERINIWKFQHFSNKISAMSVRWRSSTTTVGVIRWCYVFRLVLFVSCQAVVVSGLHPSTKGMIKCFLRCHIIKDRHSHFITGLMAARMGLKSLCVTYDLINECVNILNAN